MTTSFAERSLKLLCSSAFTDKKVKWTSWWSSWSGSKCNLVFLKTGMIYARYWYLGYIRKQVQKANYVFVKKVLRHLFSYNCLSGLPKIENRKKFYVKIQVKFFNQGKKANFISSLPLDYRIKQVGTGIYFRFDYRAGSWLNPPTF